MYEIAAYQFSPPADVFDYNKDENKCYCANADNCNTNGLFNTSVCQMGSPVMLSWPHFYQADTKYVEAVEGLRPNAEKHAFTVNISPRTGSPLGAQARMQINIATVADPLIKQVSGMKEMIFPVLWFEDGVTELPDEIVTLFRMSTESPKLVKLCLKVTTLMLGCTILIVMIIQALKQVISVSHLITKPAEDKVTKKTKSQKVCKENLAYIEDGQCIYNKQSTKVCPSSKNTLQSIKWKTEKSDNILQNIYIIPR